MFVDVNLDFDAIFIALLPYRVQKRVVNLGMFSSQDDVHINLLPLSLLSLTSITNLIVPMFSPNLQLQCAISCQIPSLKDYLNFITSTIVALPA